MHSPNDGRGGLQDAHKNGLTSIARAGTGRSFRVLLGLLSCGRRVRSGAVRARAVCGPLEWIDELNREL